MKLNELVQTYDGDVLFDARETELVRDDVLERPVEKFRVEVSPVNNVRGKTCNVTIVAVLGEMPAEGGDNTDPGTEPTPDPGTNTPSEEV